jgi:hypothetical protein
MPASFLLPNHLAIPSDLENPTATAHECHLLTRRLFNLSRHTVGFWAVVSLLAVFDLDLHGQKVGYKSEFAQRFFPVIFRTIILTFPRIKTTSPPS